MPPRCLVICPERLLRLSHASIKKSCHWQLFLCSVSGCRLQRSRYFSLPSTPSHSSASARASFFSVMFGHTSASSAFSSIYRSEERRVGKGGRSGGAWFDVNEKWRCV